jgi:pimeloyl-ACP methyl ester carboxylesterase
MMIAPLHPLQPLFLATCLILASTTPSAWAQGQTITEGSSAIEVVVRNQTLEVYCYKPPGFSGQKMIMVMHGVNRNADEYRDHAIAMADRFEALIVAPKFDTKRFPSIKYNRGGILTPDKQAAAEADWTYQLIPELAQEIRLREQQQQMPYWIIGHSAGGQFVARMSAFMDSGAERLVAANPGSQLFPNRLWPFGYGFGDLPESLSNDQRIKSYLAAPLTIYLGTNDDRADEHFDDSPEAMLQGPGRYQRGKACYAAAQQLAAERDWEFGWQLVEADGVGHDHEAMFQHPNCEQALFGSQVKSINQAKSKR